MVNGFKGRVLAIIRILQQSLQTLISTTRLATQRKKVMPAPNKLLESKKSNPKLLKNDSHSEHRAREVTL